MSVHALVSSCEFTYFFICTVYKVYAFYTKYIFMYLLRHTYIVKNVYV